MKINQLASIVLVGIAVTASASQNYKAIRISTYPNETIGLAQSGPYVLANVQHGVSLAALVANSNGIFAGQDAYYRTYEGMASGGTSLQSLVGPMAQVWAINDNGTIVGYSESSIYSNGYQAFSIANGVITRIPTLGGISNTAQAISTNNLVAGHSMKSNGVIDGILWNGTKVTDLGSLGGTHYFSNTNRTFASDAWGVNANSDVVGASWVPNGQQRGFLYRTGKMYNVGTLQGGTQSWLNQINDTGVAVGGSLLPNGTNHAAVCTALSLIDLNLYVTGLAKNVYLANANGINNNGQILCVGSDGQTYLLEPI